MTTFTAPPPDPATRRNPENDAYGTGCYLASKLVAAHPDIADDLGTLIEAARTEQYYAMLRGQPILPGPR